MPAGGGGMASWCNEVLFTGHMLSCCGLVEEHVGLPVAQRRTQCSKCQGWQHAQYEVRIGEAEDQGVDRPGWIT